MPAQNHPPSARLVFPHETDLPRAQPTEPNPTKSALHQAHLRSPVTVPLEVDGNKPLLYRYVRGYALTPKRLHKAMGTGTWDITFELSQEDFAKIPEIQPPQDPGQLSSCNFSETSQTYRLRCCWASAKGFPTENDWILTDTYWPEDLYVSVNSRSLEMRRPLHYKKYLPVDLSDVVKAGTNTMKSGIHRMSTDTRAFNVCVAVEIVSVISHSTLLANLNSTQTAPIAKTRKMVVKATTGNLGDDDEIAITTSSTTIQLFDPFSGSKIFDIPVRGVNCKHIACFDLETFLSQCKREKPGAPTAVDCWRCPICRGDVRPHMLERDEWLAGVRKVLEKQGKLDTRAIIVDKAGNWKPKPEERTGVRSASLEREERAAASSSKHGRSSNESTPVPERKKKKKIEVIELD